MYLARHLDAHSDTDGRITPASNIFFNWASSPENPKGVRRILFFTGRVLPVSIPCWIALNFLKSSSLLENTSSNSHNKDVFPLPLVDECLDTLAGNVWYSKLDANSAYWQVKIKPADCSKTAFITK
jgi:hypothetical protein